VAVKVKVKVFNPNGRLLTTVDKAEGFAIIPGPVHI
jgi:hypothetical protein